MLLTRIPNPPVISLTPEDSQIKTELIKRLLKNEISQADLFLLQTKVDAADLSDIIQRIYDLNEKYILRISAVEGILKKLDDIKNARRNKRFLKKIKGGFRKTNNQNLKVILAEGDSWFNYPIILTDIVDRISMEDHFAVYSLASGGDWLLNMLTGQHYVEELSVLHPDVFLISGGGNDLVGSSRLAAMLDPTGGSKAYQNNEWAKNLVNGSEKMTGFDQDRFLKGIGYISVDFFALLMFFHLQYYFLINGILSHSAKEGDKFFPIHIITQGYDYGIPSYKKAWGLNPGHWYVPFIRSFLGHGHWLKTPMQMRGIRDATIQKDIVYAMIYLFNEMMIGIGRGFNAVYDGSVSYIDSRGSVGEKGWTDELHPKPAHFIRTGEVFIGCIMGSIKPHYERVFIVNPDIKNPNDKNSNP